MTLAVGNKFKFVELFENTRVTCNICLLWF